MARNILFVNDRNITTDFSFVVHSLTGWPGNLGSAPRAVPMLEGPGRGGAVIDPQLIRQQPGQATMAGRFEATSLTAAMNALDRLRAALDGEVRIRTVYAPDRYCWAVLTSQDGEGYRKRVINGRVAASFSFVVKDGVAFRLEPDGYALTTGRTACPLGTVDVKPVISLHGNGSTLTDPLITLRNAGGDITQTFGFNGTLSATQVLRADGQRATIDLLSAGAVGDGWSFQSSGDFITLRTQDASFEGAAWATIELSAAAGTPLGGVDYVRAYR